MAPLCRAQGDADNPKLQLQRIGLEHVNAMARRLDALADSDEKVRAEIEFATEVCRHQAETGKRVFLSASDTLQRLQQSTEPPPPPQERMELTRDLLVRRMQTCDVRLAESLPPAKPQPETEAMRKAAALLDDAFAAAPSDPPKGLELGRAALEAGGPELWQTPEPEHAPVAGPVSRLVWLAQQLREKSDDTGDELFLAAMAQLRSTPWADPGNLRLLGGYVFAPNRRVDSKLAKAYLNAAIELLLRETGSRHAAAVAMAAELRQYAEKYLPERASQIEELAPHSEKEEIPADRQARPSESGGQTETRILKMRGEARDAAALSFIFDLVSQRDYLRARRFLWTVGQSEARDTAGRVIDLQEAGDLLAHRQVTRAAEIAARMPAGAERAVLYAALSAARTKVGRDVSVNDAMLAMRDAQGVTDTRRPYILLAIAHALSLTDTKLALDVFAQAVSGLNRGEPGEFGVTIHVGSASATASYTIAAPNLTDFGDLRAVTARLAESSIEEVERLCLGFTDPARLSDTLPVLAAAWLTNK